MRGGDAHAPRSVVDRALILELLTPDERYTALMDAVAVRGFELEAEAEGGVMEVRCNKCGYTGDEGEFPKGRDFFQNRYICGCPKCDNRQSPGGASMRSFGGERPFSYIRPDEDSTDPLDIVLHRADEAS